MYYRDHAPPHFHAEYGDSEITVDIRTGVVNGEFPKRSLAAVLEWHSSHQDELLENCRSFRAEGHTLALPNGADFAPEYLRSIVGQTTSA
jgi:hypothetical protein